MKTRPILFSADMVRALIAGQKTQTRSLIQPQPVLSDSTGFNWKGCAHGIGFTNAETRKNFAHSCPYGKPGDLLWVRESWSTHKAFDNKPPREIKGSIHYSADGEIDTGKKRPSIHMPRWASRLTLRITAVRVERLPYSWDSNPWVWVIEFEVIKANVDLEHRGNHG